MDGRGRWLDNVFVERLWRTVKYECIYLHDYATPRALEAGLAEFFLFYNDERCMRPWITSRRRRSTRRREAWERSHGRGPNQHEIVRNKWGKPTVPTVGVWLPRPRETLGMGFAGRQSPPSKKS